MLREFVSDSLSSSMDEGLIESFGSLVGDCEGRRGCTLVSFTHPDNTPVHSEVFA